MIAQPDQLMLTFEPGPQPDTPALLRVCRSEHDYFQGPNFSREVFQVVLPRAFAETAFMDEPSSWRERQRPAQVARDLGYRMWMQLPKPIRADILSGTPGTPRRVSIVSTATGMDDIPWEWLNADGSDVIAMLPSVRFVRQVPVLYVAPPLTVPLPMRVLIVLTNPKDERLLDAHRELTIIKRGLEGRTDYQVRELLEPRLEALRHALEWAPHIIHYVGHAGISGSRGHIILHDERDGTRWLSAAEIARVLPTSVRLLCLSTCVTTRNYQTGGLVRFAHCGSDLPLPTTIVNQYALDEGAAVAFWRRFYPALLTRDGDVVEAFHESRMEASTTSDGTWSWASFSLVVRDGTGHPFRIGQTGERRPERFAAEIQAQWSARLANNLANRKRSLDPTIQGRFERLDETIGSEEARIERFTRDIERS